MVRVNQSFTKEDKEEFLRLIRAFVEDLENADEATATIHGKDGHEIHLEGRFNYHLMTFGATAPKAFRERMERATDPTLRVVLSKSTILKLNSLCHFWLGVL